MFKFVIKKVGSFLDDLNPQQRRAVENTEGPSIIIAGAGSGKTKVLTYRIAYLLDKGVNPFSILALTFTNKAANEMKERIINLVGSQAKNLWMGTFHSIFARILRIEHEYIGYPYDFTIYDTNDSKNLLKRIIKDEKLDDKVYTPSIVLENISFAKTNLISWQEYQQNEDLVRRDKAKNKPLLGHLYEVYSKRCFKAMAMDFDDLLFNTYLLFLNNEEILKKYQRKFKYILIDEYQDTNFAQYMIIKYLADYYRNICVVGDDAQSIYSFRGANIGNILNFCKDFPDSNVFKLEQNYRSTVNIVEAANSVIKNNEKQIPKKIWTKNEAGEKVKVVCTLSEVDEAKVITELIIKNVKDKNLKYSDNAILYRINAQSRIFEEMLRKQNIPYKIYGALSFYQRKEIKDALAYFRLAINNFDEEALLRIINYPKRAIGDTTIDKIQILAQEKNVPLWLVLENIYNEKIDISLNVKNNISTFVSMIKRFGELIEKEDAYTAAKIIVEQSGLYNELISEGTSEGIDRKENVDELLNTISNFVYTSGRKANLKEYMYEVSLQTNEDKDAKEDSDRVALMTIHSAKGLEFPYVYVVGVEEKLFPSEKSLFKLEDLEEERRLFYVAMTRAKSHLTISYATMRHRWGDIIFTEPSRFIGEINHNYVDFIKNTQTQVKPRNHDALSKLFTNASGSFIISSFDDECNHDPLNFQDVQVGMNVKHEKFGNGKVLKIEGSGLEKKAIIYFESCGQKVLLLRLAKLSIIE